PRTIMNGRRVAAEIASSAIGVGSRSLFMLVGRMAWKGSTGWMAGRRSRRSCLSCPSCPVRFPALPLRVHLHLIAVLQSAHRIVRTRNNEVAALQPRQDLEILVAGDPHLDRHEFGAPIPADEDAVGFFPRLPR